MKNESPVDYKKFKLFISLFSFLFFKIKILQFKILEPESKIPKWIITIALLNQLENIYIKIIIINSQGIAVLVRGVAV